MVNDSALEMGIVPRAPNRPLYPMIFSTNARWYGRSWASMNNASFALTAIGGILANIGSILVVNACPSSSQDCKSNSTYLWVAYSGLGLTSLGVGIYCLRIHSDRALARQQRQ